MTIRCRFHGGCYDGEIRDVETQFVDVAEGELQITVTSVDNPKEPDPVITYFRYLSDGVSEDTTDLYVVAAYEQEPVMSQEQWRNLTGWNEAMARQRVRAAAQQD